MFDSLSVKARDLILLLGQANNGLTTLANLHDPIKACDAFINEPTILADIDPPGVFDGSLIERLTDDETSPEAALNIAYSWWQTHGLYDITLADLNEMYQCCDRAYSIEDGEVQQKALDLAHNIAKTFGIIVQYQAQKNQYESEAQEQVLELLYKTLQPLVGAASQPIDYSHQVHQFNQTHFPLLHSITKEISHPQAFKLTDALSSTQAPYEVLKEAMSLLTHLRKTDNRAARLSVAVIAVVFMEHLISTPPLLAYQREFIQYSLKSLQKTLDAFTTNNIGINPNTPPHFEYLDLGCFYADIESANRFCNTLSTLIISEMNEFEVAEMAVASNVLTYISDLLTQPTLSPEQPETHQSQLNDIPHSFVEHHIQLMERLAQIAHDNIQPQNQLPIATQLQNLSTYIHELAAYIDFKPIVEDYVMPEVLKATINTLNKNKTLIDNAFTSCLPIPRSLASLKHATQVFVQQCGPKDIDKQFVVCRYAFQQLQLLMVQTQSPEEVHDCLKFAQELQGHFNQMVGTEQTRTQVKASVYAKHTVQLQGHLLKQYCEQVNHARGLATSERLLIATQALFNWSKTAIDPLWRRTASEAEQKAYANGIHHSEQTAQKCLGEFKAHLYGKDNEIQAQATHYWHRLRDDVARHLEVPVDALYQSLEDNLLDLIQAPPANDFRIAVNKPVQGLHRFYTDLMTFSQSYESQAGFQGLHEFLEQRGATAVLNRPGYLITHDKLDVAELIAFTEACNHLVDWLKLQIQSGTRQAIGHQIHELSNTFNNLLEKLKCVQGCIERGIQPIKTPPPVARKPVFVKPTLTTIRLPNFYPTTSPDWVLPLGSPTSSRKHSLFMDSTLPLETGALKLHQSVQLGESEANDWIRRRDKNLGDQEDRHEKEYAHAMRRLNLVLALVGILFIIICVSVFAHAIHTAPVTGSAAIRTYALEQLFPWIAGLLITFIATYFISHRIFRQKISDAQQKDREVEKARWNQQEFIKYSNGYFDSPTIEDDNRFIFDNNPTGDSDFSPLPKEQISMAFAKSIITKLLKDYRDSRSGLERESIAIMLGSLAQGLCAGPNENNTTDPEIPRNPKLAIEVFFAVLSTELSNPKTTLSPKKIADLFISIQSNQLSRYDVMVYPRLPTWAKLLRSLPGGKWLVRKYIEPSFRKPNRRDAFFNSILVYGILNSIAQDKSLQKRNPSLLKDIFKEMSSKEALNLIKQLINADGTLGEEDTVTLQLDNKPRWQYTLHKNYQTNKFYITENGIRHLSSLPGHRHPQGNEYLTMDTKLSDGVYVKSINTNTVVLAHQYPFDEMLQAIIMPGSTANFTDIARKKGFEFLWLLIGDRSETFPEIASHWAKRLINQSQHPTQLDRDIRSQLNFAYANYEQQCRLHEQELEDMADIMTVSSDDSSDINSDLDSIQSDKLVDALSTVMANNLTTILASRHAQKDQQKVLNIVMMTFAQYCYHQAITWNVDDIKTKMPTKSQGQFIALFKQSPLYILQHSIDGQLIRAYLKQVEKNQEIDHKFLLLLLTKPDGELLAAATDGLDALTIARRLIRALITPHRQNHTDLPISTTKKVIQIIQFIIERHPTPQATVKTLLESLLENPNNLGNYENTLGPNHKTMVDLVRVSTGLTLEDMTVELDQQASGDAEAGVHLLAAEYHPPTSVLQTQLQERVSGILRGDNESPSLLPLLSRAHQAFQHNNDDETLGRLIYGCYQQNSGASNRDYKDFVITLLKSVLNTKQSVILWNRIDNKQPALYHILNSIPDNHTGKRLFDELQQQINSAKTQGPIATLPPNFNRSTVAQLRLIWDTIRVKFEKPAAAIARV